MRYNLFLIVVVFVLILYFCIYIEKVWDGVIVYEVKQYFVVVKMFQKEYKKVKIRIEKGKIVLKLVDFYCELNQSELLINWY